MLLMSRRRSLSIAAAGAAVLVVVTTSTVFAGVRAERNENLQPATASLPPAPVSASAVYRVRTNDPVVFLTVDDGWDVDPRVLDLVSSSHLPITTFLNGKPLDLHLNYWKQLVAAGATVEDHTVDHPDMAKLTLDRQRAEICRGAEVISQKLGRRPVLFRPPYGLTDAATLQAARECGMYATTMWSASVTNGRWRFHVHHRLEPGDIVLLHWRPYLYDDMLETLDAARAAGLHPAPLLDYIGPSATHPAQTPRTHN